MKIEKLIMKNFLSSQHSVFDFPRTTTLICGRNGSGKSAIHDALRVALLAHSPNARGVNAKSKIKTLMTGGAKDGHVSVVVTTERNGQHTPEKYERSLKTGNYSTPQPEINEFLPFLLHTKQFGSLPADYRREFLLDLGGVSVEKGSVEKELETRGCDTRKIALVSPLLLGGFADAMKYAKDQARERKGAWNQVTGQTWGAKKGETWASTAEPLPDDHAKQIEAVEKDIEDLVVKAEFHGGITAPCPHCKEPITYDTGHFFKATLQTHNPIQAQAALMEAKGVRATLERQKFLAENEKKITDEAAAIHADISGWLNLAEELSPEGVPRLVFDVAIKPINDRLAHWSRFFPLVMIDAYSQISLDGREYELCSESQQWICDAMIAEAIAYHSGLRLLLLDRMDVLDVPNRGMFIQWLQLVTKDYDTIIVTATLKRAPSLDFLDSVWIENGRPVEREQAA